jgi:hypothetical protein
MGIANGGDNDPIRFWRYLLLAAEQAGPAAGAAGPEGPGRDRF